jgi:hypothetical protein
MVKSVVTCLRTLGAIWADLVPTMIALAIYFCFADTILISQVLYYKWKNARERKESIASVASTEQEPLLSRRRSSDATGLPGSHRRRSSTMSTGSHRSDTLTKILEEDDSEDANPWLRNTVSILAVLAVGIAGWAIAWQSGVWIPAPVDDVPVSAEETAVGAKMLGYISALCYLGWVHISSVDRALTKEEF